MGTRSVVAIPLDGGFKGRYIHWDGYPSGVGQNLLDIIKRDGLERAIEVLTRENYGWSSLNPDGPDSFDPQIDYKDRAAWEAKEGRSHHSDPGGGDGRFRAVKGYGTAYTTVDGQSSPEEWITDSSDDWGTEWAYVLNPNWITVLQRRWGTPGSDGGQMIGMFGMGAESGEGWWRIIGHAYYHDSTVSASLTMQQLEDQAYAADEKEDADA